MKRVLLISLLISLIYENCGASVDASDSDIYRSIPARKHTAAARKRAARKRPISVSRRMQRRALRRQRWSTTTATEQKSKTNPAAKIRNKEQTEYQKRQKKLIALNHIAKSGVNERLQSGTTSRKQVFAPEAPVTMPASAVVQESADKPSWFQSGASPKEVADSYIKYADGKGIPRTIIIGSGRGKINERSTGNYAEKVYGNRSSRFLLVNYENGSGQGQRMKPDI